MKTLIVVAMAAALAGGCRERSEPNDGIEVERPIESEPVEPGTTDDDFVKSRETYEAEARERLARIDARIRELADRGEAKAEAAAEELRVYRDQLAEELDELGEQAKPAWERFEAKMSRGFDELERRLDQATRE